VSLYYYLQVLKQIYVADAAPHAAALPATIPFRVGVVLLAAGVLVLGCAPNLLVGKLALVTQALAWR